MPLLVSASKVGADGCYRSLDSDSHFGHHSLLQLRLALHRVCWYFRSNVHNEASSLHFSLPTTRIARLALGVSANWSLKEFLRDRWARWPQYSCKGESRGKGPSCRNFDANYRSQQGQDCSRLAAQLGKVSDSFAELCPVALEARFRPHFALWC